MPARGRCHANRVDQRPGPAHDAKFTPRDGIEVLDGQRLGEHGAPEEVFEVRGVESGERDLAPEQRAGSGTQGANQLQELLAQVFQAVRSRPLLQRDDDLGQSSDLVCGSLPAGQAAVSVEWQPALEDQVAAL